MTRDQAAARAKAMRDQEITFLKVARDPNRPFGVRYKATILAEEYEESARGFDRQAEKLERTK